MAEELDIRSIWNKGKALEKTEEVDLALVHKVRTKTTLQWIKIILQLEFWLTVVGSPFIIYFIFYDKQDIIFGWIYCFIVVVYLFYYLFLIRQIRKFSYDTDVLNNLKRILRYLSFYLLHYKVVIWISVFIGIFYGYFDAIKDEEVSERLSDPDELRQFFIITSGFTALCGSILHYLIHLIYGRKIKRLRTTVRELES